MKGQLTEPEKYYLEWVNDWINITSMAEYHLMSVTELVAIIDEGRTSYNAKY